MCPTCRLELWYAKYEDDVEFLVVVKGYSLYQARMAIVKMVRPICQSCRKPIKGAHEGALFCKRNKQCQSKRNKYDRLIKRGLTKEQAIAIIRGLLPREAR